MDVTVVLEPLSGVGFRASCVDPLPASVEGATRDEALGKLQAEVRRRLDGAEIIRIQIPAPPSKNPLWPDDEITRDVLEGIAAARAAADKHTYPWEVQERAEAQP